MCGIWSLINLIKDNKDLSKYFADFWKLQHRGPDNSTLKTFPQACVGFHRLAIMDTTFESNQPFIFQDKLKTIIFVCNGEIFNFKELINKYNLPIKKNSDCMTIPQLYLKMTREHENGLLKWQELFDNEIKGEFAFVLLEFDKLNHLQKVLVGRDQIGIRPLYYHPVTSKSTKLIFSSEIKGTVSFEDNVSEYPPGYIMQFDMNEFGNVSISSYEFKNVYRVIPHTKNLHCDEKYYLSKIRNSVINAIRRRLDADRPLAFLLSGGVDSSLVCAISARILGCPIKTFCCGMKGGTDLKYAKMVSDHIKSHHTEVYFTQEEGVESINDVVYTTETWDTTTVRASVGQYLVSKYIGTKTDCRVVLVGEGPDEVCSSYLFNWYAPSGSALHKAALNYVDEIHMYDGRRSDRCISRWGLEARIPLLDPEVIEAYWELPSEWRVPQYKGIEKWWLRKAFDGLNLLPDEVLWRKKEAFSDGVSSKEKSWYEIIQEKCEESISDEALEKCKWLHHKPPTKEAYYFRGLFNSFFGEDMQTVLPHYWQPKWNSDGKEIKVDEYIDPSARVLDVYE